MKRVAAKGGHPPAATLSCNCKSIPSVAARHTQDEASERSGRARRSWCNQDGGDLTPALALVVAVVAFGQAAPMGDERFPVQAFEQFLLLAEGYGQEAGLKRDAPPGDRLKEPGSGRTILTAQVSALRSTIRADDPGLAPDGFHGPRFGSAIIFSSQANQIALRDGGQAPMRLH
jgi:hypothetical protein